MTKLDKYYIDIYGYHMRMKNFIRLLMLMPLSLIITNIYENKIATVINLIALTIFLFFEPLDKSIIGKGTKYLIAMTLIVDIGLHLILNMPKLEFAITIANYSIMLISVLFTLVGYSLDIIDYYYRTKDESIIDIFKQKVLENKKISIYIIGTSYISYFSAIIMYGYRFSWRISNIDLSDFLELIMAFLIIQILIAFICDFYGPLDELIDKFERYKLRRKINHNENKDYPDNKDNLNEMQTIKTTPIAKHSEFEQINDDIQNYIDAIAIQAFNQYEPQKHVLNALTQAKKDIQQIAQNCEMRQQIDNNDNLARYFEQAEQIKENTKKLCHEFLDYVEQHKTLSSTEDIQNIQTILEKLNHKGE